MCNVYNNSSKLGALLLLLYVNMYQRIKMMTGLFLTVKEFTGAFIHFIKYARPCPCLSISKNSECFFGKKKTFIFVL